MKRIFLSAVMLLMLSLIVNAQIKTSRQYTPIDLDIKIKRCVVSGTQGYIDLVFTNHTGAFIKDVKVETDEPCLDRNNETVVYDDEGNVYKYAYQGGIRKIIFGGEDSQFNFTNLPEDVPVKMRIELEDISEYATEFTMLNIAFRNISSHHYGVGSVTFRNIPITRVE